MGGDVVTAYEERDGDEEEDEEGRHRQQIAENGKVREEPDKSRREDHGGGGVDRGLRVVVDAREPWRDEMRPRDVREVARLSNGGHQQHGRDPLERAERDNVLGPGPADVGKRDGERRAFVDLGEWHHHCERERHQHVDHGADHHGANETDRNVTRRVLHLLRHRRYRVEPQVREEQHRCRAEDPARAEVEEVVG